MTNKFFKFFFIILTSFSTIIFGQIKIKEAGSKFNFSKYPVFFDITKTRNLIPLDKNWSVSPLDEPEKSLSVNIPASFEGKNKLEFRTSFELTDKQLLNNKIELHFLRLNYSADILLNEVIIAKHTAGNYPFAITLPKDILKFGKANTLKVRILHKLDSENTIPVAQRFLFPKNEGGILDQVYLHLVPVNGISDLICNEKLSSNRKISQVDISFNINKNKIARIDSLSAPQNNLFVNVSILDMNGNVVKSSINKKIRFAGKATSTYLNQNFELVGPRLWSPKKPDYYFVKISYYSNNNLIDETSRQISFVDVKHSSEGFTVNGKPFNIKGTTYYFFYGNNGGLIDYNQLYSDLTIIKNTGFNTVRFAKDLPSPLAINLCNKIGLFVQVELPVNSVPGQILSKKSFIDRIKALTSKMIISYGHYQNVLSFGIGGGFIPNEQSNLKFVSEIGNYLKLKTNKTIYASFVGLPNNPLDNVDLIGVELFAANPESKPSFSAMAIKRFGRGNVFISEATYPTYNGNTNGYLNKFSFEAQAEYFDKIIDFSNKNKISGFIINSMFDYRGDFNSLFTGYTSNNLYRIGLLGELDRTDRIALKVVKAKLLKKEKVTVPIGSRKDSSPFLFIILTVILAIIMAMLINSKRKFREAATRALLRSYNFFADIRDLRILSGVHTTLLMFTLSGIFSLLITIILNYLKNNLLLEKILLSFNSEFLLTFVSFLSWHPMQSFIYLFLISVGLIILHTVVIKVFSLFLKTRVLITSIFFTVVWALLPLTLILPLELVLHRLLIAEIGNLYIYIFILLYMIWLNQRILKGVYVIFDIRLSTVYFYAITFFVFVFGTIFVYYQLSDSTLYYILSAVKQYQFL